MTDSTSSKDLAKRMVHTLPGWGLWAVDVRDFQTPYGSIGFRQASILWILRSDDFSENERTPTGIAKYFGIQNSAITRAVDKLEQGGYIQREVAFEDRRRHYLVPTQKGIDISTWIEQLFTAPLQDVLSEIGEEQMDALSSSVESLFQILRKTRAQTKAKVKAAAS